MNKTIDGSIGGRSDHARPVIAGLLALLLALMGACSRDQQDRGKKAGEPTGSRTGDNAPVASVGKSVITVDDFKKAMIVRGGMLTDAFADERNKSALLDEMIRFEVMAEKAREAGYFERPEIARVMKKMAVEAFGQDQLNAVAGSNGVTDAEIEDFYAGHQVEFTAQERVRAALIFVRVPATVSAEKKQELAALADQVRQEAAALDPGVKHLGSLAAKYSDDQATRYKGGDIGWLSRGAPNYRWESNVVETILALSKTGSVSQVAAFESGFYIFKLIEKQAPTVIPLDAVRENVRLRIERSRRADLMDKLYQESKRSIRVWKDADLLKSISLPRKEAPQVRRGPPSLPQD